MSTTESDDDVFIISATESPDDVLVEADDKNETYEDGYKNSSKQLNGLVSNSVRVFKQDSVDKGENNKVVLTFDDQFTNIIGLSLASPSRAWFNNCDKAMLVDIQRGEIVVEYNASCIRGSFCHVKCKDEHRILFLDSEENKISRMAVENSILPIVDFNTGICCLPKLDVLCFVILRTGQILSLVNKAEGLLCLLRDVAYLQLHSSYGNFIREVALENYTKNVIPQTYDIVENYNGDICIAAQKCTRGYSECVIVLDMNLNFRFTYEEENESIQFSSPSITVNPSNNNILIATQQQCISIIDQNGIFLRQLSVENLRPEGVPRKIAVDTEQKLWIVTSLGKIICLQIEGIIEKP